MRTWIYLVVLSLAVGLNDCQQQFSLSDSSNYDSSEAPLRDSSPSPASVQYRVRPYEQQYSQEEEDEAPPLPVYQQRRPVQQQNYISNKKIDPKKQQQLEEELEEEEPDRLSLLLQKSNFQCSGRTTGYYADEELGCEVFHYCQENSKHSWICPEGFSFHQVHLICMPPSTDNICEQSAKYHFVNEYLYKPINMEEHQARPNVSLRYSERYYPEEVYHDERQEYLHERSPQTQQKQPVHVGLNAVRKAPTPLPYNRQQQQQLQQQVSPSPHSVFRSPEEINIPLQQRRPVIYNPTTPRYEEADDDEYHYEK